MNKEYSADRLSHAHSQGEKKKEKKWKGKETTQKKVAARNGVSRAMKGSCERAGEAEKWGNWKRMTGFKEKKGGREGRVPGRVVTKGNTRIKKLIGPGGTVRIVRAGK